MYEKKQKNKKTRPQCWYQSLTFHPVWEIKKQIFFFCNNHWPFCNMMKPSICPLQHMKQFIYFFLSYLNTKTGLNEQVFKNRQSHAKSICFLQHSHENILSKGLTWPLAWVGMTLFSIHTDRRTQHILNSLTMELCTESSVQSITCRNRQLKQSHNKQTVQLWIIYQMSFLT